MKTSEWNNRPWGRHKTLGETSTYKYKILEIFPNKRFSLQYHNHRNEYWVVLEGKGKITKGEKDYIVDKKSKDIVFIDIKELHRAENVGKGVLRIFELQTGECREDDIVKLQDDFGRIKFLYE